MRGMWAALGSLTHWINGRKSTSLLTRLPLTRLPFIAQDELAEVHNTDTFQESSVRNVNVINALVAIQGAQKQLNSQRYCKLGLQG